MSTLISNLCPKEAIRKMLCY